MIMLDVTKSNFRLILEDVKEAISAKTESQILKLNNPKYLSSLHP